MDTLGAPIAEGLSVEFEFEAHKGKKPLPAMYPVAPPDRPDCFAKSPKGWWFCTRESKHSNPNGVDYHEAVGKEGQAYARWLNKPKNGWF